MVGTGPGTWVIQRVAETNASEPNEYIPYAHNLEAQTLAELGLVGVAAGIVLIGAMLGCLRYARCATRRAGAAAGPGRRSSASPISSSISSSTST